MAASTTNPSSESKKCVIRTTLGVAKDGIQFAAKPAVAAGFSIAHLGVDAGLCWIPRFFLFGKSIKSLKLAHSITRSSLALSSKIVQSSLDASNVLLELAGAENGETYRLLSEYVESQSHLDGHDTREALLSVAALLVEALGHEIMTSHFLSLLKGARKLAILHETRREERIARRQAANVEITTTQYTASMFGDPATFFACCVGAVGQDEQGLVVPNSTELSFLSRYMRFAAAAYGAKSLKFMGCDHTYTHALSPLSLGYSTSDVDAISSLTGIPTKDVLLCNTAHERRNKCLYQPAHYVAVDHVHRTVVVAIRGTMSMHDVLVDLKCNGHDYASVYDDNVMEVVDGTVHGGFLKSAQVLSKSLCKLVTQTLAENPHYQLLIVGHSLGGAVATLLAMLWANDNPAFRNRHHVQAISYASPCVVCDKLSQARFTRRHVTSVVTGDDVVSRFSLSTFRELQQHLLAACARNDDENATSIVRSESTAALKDNGTLEKKLYCAGRVWWLESKEYEPHPIVEVDPVEELNEIGLFPGMFAIHMPKAYVDSLDKLEGQARR